VRKAFARAIMEEFSGDDCFFLTGDLGFMALEGVRDALGGRFINCGVAEQNMIGVAAGLAREGFRVFAYSIAPFCYARPFEQIRNDLAFTGLPVCLVGNGGGYAYGHMGPTHHALEDCAAMNALGIRVFAPAFDADILPQLRSAPRDAPCWLRLGREELPQGSPVPAYAPWRRLLEGSAGALAALGPLAGTAWSALAGMREDQRPELWAVTELPASPPPEFSAAVEGKPLYVVEEHSRDGGLGMQLLYSLASAGVRPGRVAHRFALGYPSGRYGSQAFHRRECGLDADSLLSLILRGGGGGGKHDGPAGPLVP
jgi:transketolase